LCEIKAYSYTTLVKTTFLNYIFLLLILVFKLDEHCEKNQCDIHMKASINTSNNKSQFIFLRVSKRAKHQTWIINSWKQLNYFWVFTSRLRTYKHKPKIIQSTHGIFSFMQKKRKRELIPLNFKRRNSLTRKRKTISQPSPRMHQSNGIVHHDLHNNTYDDKNLGVI